jgi:glycosyltransferase involved in cell wall biosynthesis
LAELLAQKNRVTVVHLLEVKGQRKTGIQKIDSPLGYKEVFIQLPEKRFFWSFWTQQIRYYKGLFVLLNELKADGVAPYCIHAQVAWKCGFDAALLGWRFGIPFLVTEHNTDWLPEDRSYPFWKRMLSRWALKRARAVTAVSEKLGLAIETELNKQVEVIPNVIHSVFLNTPRQPEPKVPVFLHISNFRNRHKQTDLIVKVFSQFAEENKSVRLQLNVPGGEFDAFKQTHPQYSWDRIEWLPPSTDRETLADRMSKATCLISYSRFETFGLTMAEAACLGVPSIYTPCGGADVFFNDSMGAKCDADDEQSLLQAMRHAAKPGRFDRGLIAETAGQLFSNDKVLKAYEKLYRNIAG